jgi:hypothetical protein
MSNFQNVTPNQFGQLAATTSYAVLYTVPSNVRAYLKQIDICNTTGSAIGIYVSLVPAAGTASASNALYYNTSVPANTTLSYSGAQILLSGATIQIKASTTGLTVTASGGEAV